MAGSLRHQGPTSLLPATSCACAGPTMKSISVAGGVQLMTQMPRGICGGFPRRQKSSDCAQANSLPLRDRFTWGPFTARAHSTRWECTTSPVCAYSATAIRAQAKHVAMSYVHFLMDSINSPAEHIPPAISPTECAHRRKRTRIHGARFTDRREHDRLQRTS